MEKSILEDIEFIKSISNGIADTKKDAQHIRGSLNRIVKASETSEYHAEMYDDLLGAYCRHGKSLKTISEILHMKLTSVVEPENKTPVKYFLTINPDEKNEIVIEITGDQYADIARAVYDKTSEEFKK